MAIENPEITEYTETGGLLPIQSYLHSNNTLYAGNIKVKYPLTEETYLLYGFIGDCKSMNFDDFKVNGMNIEFYDGKKDEYHKSTIYPKVLFDLKKHVLFYEIYSQLNELKYTTNYNDRIRKQWHSETDPDLKKNYYFFENSIIDVPNATSDELYLICKYVSDGKFKYVIFSPHEIAFER